MSVWDDYTKIGEEKNSKIKAYKARKVFLVKEINFQNEEEKISMLVALKFMKNEVNIYNIYEDYNKFNVIIDEDMQMSEKFDELFNNNLSGFKNEVVIKENGKHSKFNEIKKIYEKGEKK